MRTRPRDRTLSDFPPVLCIYADNTTFMGQVVAIVTAAASIVTVIAGLIVDFTRQRPEPNPTMTAIENAVEDHSEEKSPEPDVKTLWHKKEVPLYYPSIEQFNRARDLIQDPDERIFHFGVSGSAKAGKSSLLNSLRGLGRKHPDAAKVGHTEATLEITRYNDPRRNFPFAWYDIPGAGTQEIPAKDYFNEQGLFAMDCILIVVGHTFMEFDGELIEQCQKLDIPTYIIRSRCDEAIRNELEGREPRSVSTAELDPAKSSVLKEITGNIRKNLGAYKKGLLKDQRVYLVNEYSMKRLAESNFQAFTIDPCAFHEAELIHDILKDAKRRRL